MDVNQTFIYIRWLQKVFSLTHLYLVCFFHSSRQILSNPNHQIGWGMSLNCYLQVSPPSICSIVLAIYFELLLFWKVNLQVTSLRSCALWNKLSTCISLYLVAFVLPSVVTNLTMEKHPCYHHQNVITQLMSITWVSSDSQSPLLAICLSVRNGFCLAALA